mmetsp:Transcript_95603/g.169773  ORF Transcript_95603/g.169773 Transcript_95603/m.169773 type:complete len:452 (-) Transcript_95603:101-1456(-)|eukprot:CAMPEP_0197661436 /NCGR_PEP_ID=MMETSP1338-20131121/51454_1 /TAXON_ID=43686 ORGANISM="Pelagodinium beii, Strain RCC1491" /NCGR_SAMPLE_ID=MMETSP1338 /ASSEMBLY_ACC=CAM_ASM_000754 /LENGTH=451 /DNA_ID=CAMNT_0043238989 /DNA_START=140 /DNA_END=1495 /DNA_ORIENTATION=+
MAASTGQEAEVQSNADSCGTSVQRQAKKGRGMKWLAKCIFPNLRSKGKCKSAASDEEIGSLSLVTNAGPLQAWQAETGSDAVTGQESPDVVLRTTADAADHSNDSITSRSPEKIEASKAEPDSEAALAKSNALAKALASSADGGQEQKIGRFDEIYSRAGKEPLPLELLDEPTGGAVNADLDVDSLLPPLPALDTQRLDVKADIPGCASEHSVPGGLEEEAPWETGTKPTSQPLSGRASPEIEVRPRPASFRKEPSPSKSSPQKPMKSGYSMASRPTTAGGETAVTIPTSRQSTESTAWNEQWGHTKQSKIALRKPIRGLASVHVPAQLAGEKPPLPLKSLEKQRVGPPKLPLPAPQSQTFTAAQDPLFAFALKRASESSSLNAALAPGVDRRRVRLEKLEIAALEEDFEDEFLEVPIKKLSLSELKDEPAEPKSDFSDLAVSFASLTDDM